MGDQYTEDQLKKIQDFENILNEEYKLVKSSLNNFTEKYRDCLEEVTVRYSKSRINIVEIDFMLAQEKVRTQALT